MCICVVQIQRNFWPGAVGVDRAGKLYIARATNFTSIAWTNMPRCLTVLGPITVSSNQPTHRCVDGASSSRFIVCDSYTHAYDRDVLVIAGTCMWFLTHASDMHTATWEACSIVIILFFFLLCFSSSIFLLHLSIFFFRQAWTLIIHVILFIFIYHALLFFFYVFLYKFYFLIQY